MTTDGFKPTNPASEWTQTHTLHQAATVISKMMSNLLNFLFFVSWIVDKQFATLKQHNAKHCSLDTYITLNIPACIDPQWIIIRKQNQSNTA
jgi:hypothetical protein